MFLKISLTTVYKNSFEKKKKKKEALFLLENKTIICKNVLFLDNNWTKFGNKNYCTKHYIL